MNMNIWEFEPNRLSFVENGLKCEIIRSPFGFLNAYIYIPEGNIYHGIDDLNLTLLLKPSVDISYAEYSNSFWKIGISFSSIKDYVPYLPENNEPEFMKKMKEFLGHEEASEKDYKTIDHAIAELKLLVLKITKIS